MDQVTHGYYGIDVSKDELELAACGKRSTQRCAGATRVLARG